MISTDIEIHRTRCTLGPARILTVISQTVGSALSLHPPLLGWSGNQASLGDCEGVGFRGLQGSVAFDVILGG